MTKSPKNPFDFSRPETAGDLPPYIGIEPDFFDKIISSGSRSEFYLRHEISKRSRKRRGESRIVWQVDPFAGWGFTEAHKAFARRFEIFARWADVQYPHSAAYGYVRDRGIHDNAKVHCGARLLMRADIVNFFDSISAQRLANRFIKLGVKIAPAQALAKFATIDDRLAPGLNASPMLANLICMPLDIKLEAIAQKYNCKYTRYADDISVSGADHLPDRGELEKVLSDEGFQLNERKYRVTKNGQAHYVTGLSISDKKRPHAPRRMKRRLRQELYYAEKYGIDEHLWRAQSNDASQQGVNRLDGTIQYISYHEPDFRDRLKLAWQKILTRDGYKPNFESR